MLSLMPFRRLLFVGILLSISCTILPAQDKVQGNLESADTVSLSVIRIYPDSFPNVSVIFRATSPSGQPLWNLDNTNVKVKENGLDCAVVSVKKLSQNESINTALVIDHSGSMSDNPNFRAWSDSINRLPKRWKKISMREYTNGKTDSDSLIMVSVQPVCPPQCQPPIMHAKAAAKTYLASIDSSKDKTALIGFSSVVDENLPLSFNRNRQRTSIDQMRADGSTAFYDGVYSALDAVNQGTGIKAVVAITDGEDNSSVHSLSQLIKRAKELDIPVYVVGLGDVNKKVLRKLAKETGGEYYYTQDATQLSSIYLAISKRIKSVYELTYASPSLASADSIRDVELSFEIGNEFIRARSLKVALPENVLTYLKEREALIQTGTDRHTNVNTPVQQEESSLPYAAGVVVLVAAAGVLVTKYHRNQKKKVQAVELISVYPNPTSGPTTLVLNTDISAMPGQVTVTDQSGQVVLTAPFPGGSAMDFDLGSLSTGTYFVSVQAGGNITSPKQVVVMK